MAGTPRLKNALIALSLLGSIAAAMPPIGHVHARLRTGFAGALAAVGLCQPEWRLFAPNVHKLNSRIVAELVLEDGSVRYWASPEFAQRSLLQKLRQGQLPKFYDNLRRDRNHAAWRSFAAWVVREAAPDARVRLIRLERRYSEVLEPEAGASLPPRGRRGELRSHVFYEARFEMRTALASRTDAYFGAVCQPPADVRVLAGLRIGYASLILIHWLVFLPDVEMLWSDRGVLPLSQLSAVVSGFVPTLFYFLPRSTTAAWIAYALLGIHAALLLVGYRTRLQAAAVLIWLVSFQNRNPLLVNGQDAILRLIGFWLLLLPIGNAFSLDALRKRHPPSSDSALNAWPLRLLQLQIALVMFAAAIWKLRGNDWVEGNALYYVTRLDGFWGNFPVPAALLSSAPALGFLTYATLAIELSVPVLIWVPKLRRVALATAIGFHLALAYAMNLFLFEWIMILGWCAFLRREDLAAFGGGTKK